MKKQISSKVKRRNTTRVKQVHAYRSALFYCRKVEVGVGLQSVSDPLDSIVQLPSGSNVYNHEPISLARNTTASHVNGTTKVRGFKMHNKDVFLPAPWQGIQEAPAAINQTNSNKSTTQGE